MPIWVTASPRSFVQRVLWQLTTRSATASASFYHSFTSLRPGCLALDHTAHRKQTWSDRRTLPQLDMLHIHLIMNSQFSKQLCMEITQAGWISTRLPSTTICLHPSLLDLFPCTQELHYVPLAVVASCQRSVCEALLLHLGSAQ